MRIKLDTKEHEEEAEIETPVKKDSGPKLRLSKRNIKAP